MLYLKVLYLYKLDLLYIIFLDNKMGVIILLFLFGLLFFQIQLVLTLFCLCGLLFLSGAVRKELILFYFFSEYYNFFISIFYFFIIFLTFSYRYHL